MHDTLETKTGMAPSYKTYKTIKYGLKTKEDK